MLAVIYALIQPWESSHCQPFFCCNLMNSWLKSLVVLACLVSLWILRAALASLFQSSTSVWARSKAFSLANQSCSVFILLFFQVRVSCFSLASSDFKSWISFSISSLFLRGVIFSCCSFIGSFLREVRLVLGDFYEAHASTRGSCAVGLSAVKKNGVG